MFRKHILIYLMVLSIPILLGLVVWQSNRYQNLTRELTRLEQVQREWVESNKRLVAGIAESSSIHRIDYLAQNQLDLRKIQPEYFLQVRIVGGKEHEY